MAEPTDIEKDSFLTLLTDALLAGPDSPAWRDAIAALNTNRQNVDEYRLLIDAREALQSGKDYRSVRAGAGFTRKLLNNIDDQAAGPASRFPVAGIIGLLAGLIIVIVIGVLIYQFLPQGNGTTANSKAINDLASTYFPNEILSAKFDQGIPPAWRKIGSLPLETTPGGLRPGAADVTSYVGGGVVVADPLPADQSFSMQASLTIKGHNADVIPQVFVSNSNDFSADRAISSQELVWELKGSQQQAVVSGKVEQQAAISPSASVITVRLIVNRDLVIIESDGQRLWAGPNSLGDHPRYVGLRFIQTSPKPVANIAVQSIVLRKS
jgi:hypothetical protein